MNSFDAFFPNSRAPRNPYRHTPATRGSGGRSTPRAPHDRIFVAIGTLVCFVLFVAWTSRTPTEIGSMPPSVDAINGAAAPAPSSAPRLKGARAAEVALSPPTSLKLMTFNLRFAGANDGFNGWRYRKDHVADIINRYHPAIMGTQEGLKDQLAELQTLLTHPYERYGVEREVNGEYEQIFYDTSIVSFLQGGNFWLSETPDKAYTQGWDAACVRLVTWCQFRLLATGQEFYFFNTQLDHVGARSRAEGSKLLWERMQAIAGGHEEGKAAAAAPLFLMGDFNTYRHTKTYSYFTTQSNGPLLKEAWPEAEEQIGDVSFTYHGWAGVLNDGERGAVRAANHIDWIFYRPEMKVLTTEVITEARNGRYPSDHYPIQAEVLFPSVAELPPPTR